MERSIRLLLLATVLLFPAGGLAHGLDVMFAKLAFLPEGEVQLDVSVDYADSTILPDLAAARQMITESLGIDRGQGLGRESLMSCGTPIFSETPLLDPTTPPAYTGTPEDPPHQFAKASWRWKPTSGLLFSMPKSCPLDVVLWTVPQDKNMSKAAMFYLIPNESTFTIPLEGPLWDGRATALGKNRAAFIFLGAVLVAVIITALWAKRRNPKNPTLNLNLP